MAFATSSASFLSSLAKWSSSPGLNHRSAAKNEVADVIKTRNKAPIKSLRPSGISVWNPYAIAEPADGLNHRRRGLPEFGPEPFHVHVDCSGLDDMCNVGVCNGTSGECEVQSLADGTSCDDGDACTSDDSCQLGACVSGDPADCDDGNECTDDTCDSGTGCVYTAVGDGTSCDDELLCTENDSCTTGVCGGTAVDWADNIPQPKAHGGTLQAWDPITQKAVWKVPQEDTWNAGTLTTAGNLVFQGRSDGKFIAYDATTGTQLWSYDLGLGISAPPITYKIDGKQYIALLVGYGGGAAAKIGDRDSALGWAYGKHTRRLVTFALDGATELPAQPAPFYPTLIVDADFKIDTGLAELGKDHWSNKGCAGCHGRDARAGGMAPDLRASQVPVRAELFQSIVREGALSQRAMPGFPDISDEELLALRHYIRRQAKLSAATDGAD